MLAQLDACLSSDPSDVEPFTRAVGTADLPPAKRARVLPTPPTKCQSSLVFVGVANDGLQEGARTPPLSKYAKLEPIKSPLASVDANTGLMATDAVQPACSLPAHDQHHNYANMEYDGHPMFFQEATMQAYTRHAFENPPFDDNFFFGNDVPLVQGVASGSQMTFGQTAYQWPPPDDVDAMDTDEELKYILAGLTDPRVDVDQNTYGGKDQFIASSSNHDE